MSDKRFKVIDDDFSKWIVDTTLKEDKHEGAIYTAYDMCHKLNELCEENDILKQKLRKNYIANKQYDEMKRLQKENEQLKARIHELSWQLDEERKLQKLDALHRIKNLEDSK